MINITDRHELHARGIRGRWTTAAEGDVLAEISRLQATRAGLVASLRAEERRSPCYADVRFNIRSLARQINEIDIDLDALEMIRNAHAGCPHET